MLKTAIDLGDFFDNIQVFAFYGETDYKKQPVIPCKIKVAQNYFIDIDIASIDCTVDCWYGENGNTIYLYNQKVEFVLLDGVLVFDALNFLEENNIKYSCQETAHYPTLEHYLTRIECNSTEKGIYFYEFYRGELESRTSYVYYAPRAFKLFSHEIRYISWMMSDEDYAITGDMIRPAIEKTLNPHSVSEVYSYKEFDDFSPSSFDIETTRGKYEFDDFLGFSCVLDGKKFDYNPTSEKEGVALLLLVLKMQTHSEIETAILKAQLLFD